jgi:excisionase family DNA binding protein
MTLMTTRDHRGEYLTVAEGAAELHCSEPTVRRRIRSGEIPACQLGGPGSSIRIPRSALDLWLWSGTETRG